MSETVQQMVKALTADRDIATNIVIIDCQPYAIRVEKITTPEQMQRATDEFMGSFNERSN